jgi:uncharacterized protein (DUF885 family)
MSSFDAWTDDFASQWVRLNPQLATATQYFTGGEQRSLDSDLALSNQWGQFYGCAAAERLAALAREGLDALRRYPTADLNSVQRVSAAALDWHLRDSIANAEFAAHRFVFSQIFGFQVLVVNFMAAGHPVRDSCDVETYLARLRRLPHVLDEGIAEARAAACAGIVPPRFILERTIEQLDDLTCGPASNHVLVASLTRRMQQANAIAAYDGNAFAETACDEIRDRTIPAFRRVREFMAEQLPHAIEGAGAWALPDGERYYARQLASATGTSLSALQIHEIGLREVERIESELERLLRKLGHTGGTIARRLKALNETVRIASDPDPREAILNSLQSIMDDAAARARLAFHLVPKAPVVIRREPEFSEKSAAAHYTTPAPDGSMPGIYWVPLADLDPNVPWIGIGLKSTAYHEAIPGHHFQLALEQESTTLPYFRKKNVLGYNPAFNEGWALYAERLAAESGWYDDDLAGYAGYLQQQLFRARRLVVDTGMHAMRWTREQAIEYGFTAAEVERYASWPGQACAYMIGQLRILELREAAKSRLASRFDLKAFHDVVLGGGTLPLAVLADEVTRKSPPNRASYPPHSHSP